jgi:hypothetical protein
MRLGGNSRYFFDFEWLIGKVFQNQLITDVKERLTAATESHFGNCVSSSLLTSEVIVALAGLEVSDGAHQAFVMNRG